jgi:hypothetical protein
VRAVTGDLAEFEGIRHAPGALLSHNSAKSINPSRFGKLCYSQAWSSDEDPTMKKRLLLPVLFLVLSVCGSIASAQAPDVQPVVSDLKAETSPFPHFWEQAFGSGRAILTLRESRRPARSEKGDGFSLRSLSRDFSR